MSFKIQQHGSGLFWGANVGDRIRLANEGSTYEIDSEGQIRNIDTGLYVRHSYWILSEAELVSADNDFKWIIDDSGLIHNDYDGSWYVIPEGGYLKIVKGDMYSWNIIKEVADEDVPVSRASALIEEALNAKAASCGCECGCGPNCEGCECECGCPKAPVEVPVEAPVEVPVEVPVEAPVEVPAEVLSA